MSEMGFKPTTSVFEEHKIVHASVHINHTCMNRTSKAGNTLFY